jgi:hypothetical protein
MAAAIGACVRLIAAGLMGAAIAWLAVSQSEAHWLSIANPSASLGWRRSNSEGLAAAAQTDLANASSKMDYERVKSRVRDELARAPMTVGAFRDLANLAELSSDMVGANALMTMSDRLSHRDDQTERWLFFHRLATADYPEAMLQADLLARRNHDIDEWALFLPQIIPALRQPTARQALVGRLALRPAWRPSLMSDLASDAPEPAVVEDVFLQLRALNSGPDPDEISPLANRLLSEGRFSEARAVWGRLVGARSSGVNLIYDGNFEGWPGPPPFNWRLQSQGGVYADLTTVSDGGARALRTEAPGNDSNLLAEQRVVASGGHYRLSGRIRVERLADGGAFQWEVWCSSTNTQLAMASFDSVGPLRTFQVDFVAPDNCGTLAVRLQSVGGDGTGQAIAWSDRLSLTLQSTS